MIIVFSLAKDGIAVLESEVDSGLEEYNYDSLKSMLVDDGLTCK